MTSPIPEDPAELRRNHFAELARAERQRVLEERTAAPTHPGGIPASQPLTEDGAATAARPPSSTRRLSPEHRRLLDDLLRRHPEKSLGWIAHRFRESSGRPVSLVTVTKHRQQLDAGEAPPAAEETPRPGPEIARLREPPIVATASIDLEIAAMGVLASALAGLDFEAIRRVLQWAGDRYGITLVIGPRAA